MKNLRLTATLLSLAVSLVPAAALAQSSAGGGPKARLFAKYDTNKNGVIDGDEVAAVRKAYADDPKGEFAKYDSDHDGKLSDAEIAAIKPPGGAGKAGDKKAPAAKKDAPAEKSDAKPAPEKKTDGN